ncbi:MAG TPA: ATP12 family protein, partial [Caulobacteraceae bacterium]|nr:ATP12 family protein [Caulobacteraceae bacterium]
MAKPSDHLQKPRRFYKVVTSELEAEEKGFAVRLDGRTPRTPQGRPLVAPTRGLAELIAEEWRGQGDWIIHATMPATRLAHTAIDAVATARGPTAEGVVRYAGNDLLCYFAEGPARLVRRQEKTWGLLLDWARDAHGLVFARAAGVVHRPQPPETLARLAALLTPMDDFGLAGMAFAAALFGSAILALALRGGRINADEAMAAARLDEIFQEEQWGVDAEAAARADAMA